jgi:hypothetical protein
MWVGLLFAFLGIFGSALPGHLFMRVLAYREHLDRQLPFEPGTENGGMPYAWWLMRFGQKGFLSAVFGWITLLALIAAAFSFIMSKA